MHFPLRALSAAVCLALASCAPHVRPASPSTILKLKKPHSQKNTPSAPSTTQPALAFKLRLAPGSELTLPLISKKIVPSTVLNLNGTPLRWIVDTGANFPILVDSNSAVSAHLTAINGLRAQGTGVGGKTNVLIAKFNSLDSEHQPILSPGFTAILLKSYHEELFGIPVRHILLNLLGLPFLERFSFITVDPHKKQLRMGFQKEFLPAPRAKSFPFRNQNGELVVDLRIDGRTFPAVFDTGYGGCIKLTGDASTQIRESAFASPESLSHKGLGIGGVVQEKRRILREVLLDGIRLSPIACDTNPTHSRVMLGWMPFRSHRVTLDFKRNRVWIED